MFYRVKIFQYDCNTGDSSFLAYVTPGSNDFWSDAVLVKLPSAARGAGIDKYDIVNVWGDAPGCSPTTPRSGHAPAVPPGDGCLCAWHEELGGIARRLIKVCGSTDGRAAVGRQGSTRASRTGTGVPITSSPAQRYTRDSGAVRS